ncbi:MAG: T9SS type A sorting domain-containing protein [Bacteroidota bacterium]
MEYFSPPPKRIGFSKAIFTFLLLSLVFSYTKSNAQYCTPTYGFGGCDEFLSNVTIANINNSSGCAANFSQYEDFTSTFTDLIQGLGTPFNATIGPPFYSADQISVFIDWNQDLDFNDAGESFTTSNNGNGYFTGMVDVPVSAPLGLTRMRVMMSYNVAPAPCNENGSFFGETEDYSVNVQPGSTCAYPSLLNVSNIGTTYTDLNWTGSGSATFYKVRYKKVSDPTTVPTWANPTTVLAPTTTLTATGLTATTQYEFQVNSFCSATDSSGFVFSATWFTGCFDCPAGSIPEAEACGDDVNGGCNMAVPFFEPINCGDTICGTSWASGFIRDTDWFTFNITNPGIYTITAITQFPAQMGYLGPNLSCPITSFTDYTSNPNACDTLSLTGYLTAGSWIYFISPSVFDGYPCGGGANNYVTYVCADNPPLVVANDACDGAIMLTQNATCIPTIGDVAGAFIQTGAACSGTAEDDVWYSFVATASSAIIQVTGSSSFDAVFEVFDACGGNSLACVNNFFGGGNTESQTIGGFTVGNTYYIRVYDAGFTPPATTTFDICIFDAPPGPANDDCSGAIVMNCGDIVTGSTLTAAADLAGLCGTQPTAPGVWYTIVGDGSVMTASLCNGTTWDTKLNVYSGTCANLTCVSGNDDFCGLQSQVSFLSQVGVNYYILVNGYNNATGDFQLEVTCALPCITCSPTYTPEAETCGSDVNGGCNMAVPFFEPIACGDTICGTGWASGFTRDTDWFTFDVAAGGVYTITAKTSFPAQMGYIGPFPGPVTSADCPIFNFTDYVTSPNECDSLSLTGYLATGTWIYFISPSVFDGYPCGSGKNDYITYVCAPNPPVIVVNDVCDSAILLTQNTTCVPTSGDVNGAFIQQGPGCSFGNPNDDIWYKFVATTTNPVIEVTGSGSFDAVVEVFDNCGGNQVACIDATFTGGVESQQITAVIGTTYYIRVYDYYSGYPATTTFDICVYDAPPPCITCSPSYTPENEVCGSDVNGGCNMAVPFFEPILCGDTLCGSAWMDNGTRDTDWFTFDVTTPGLFTFVAITQFPCTMGYIGPNATCPIFQFDQFVNTPNECDTLSITSYLTAGTWIYAIVPYTPSFTGYPCGGGKNTYITYVCAPTPPLTVPNDICDSAILITQNPTCQPTAGDVAGAIIQQGPACSGFADDDVWYKWVATGNSAIVQVTGSPSFDAVVEVYDNCGGVQLACIDATFTGGVESQLVSGLTAGNTYYIRVFDWNFTTPATTTFDVCVYDAPPPPVNDEPCGAIALSIGANGPFDNSQATTSANDPAVPGTDCQANDSWCPFGGNLAENTLWFTFTAPASGRIVIQSPDFDTELAIWDATDCNSFPNVTLIAANDDDPNYVANGSTIFSSYVYSDCLTPGNTYYVELDGYSGTVGSTNINLTDPGTIDASFATLNIRYCPTANPVTLTPATAGGTFSGTGMIGNVFNPSIAGVGGPYDIVYTLLGCITDTVSTTVEYPVADITPSGPVQVCYGQAIPLTTPYVFGYHYKWKRYSVTVATGTNTYTPTSSGLYKYSVKVTDSLGGGCFTVDTVMYKIINFPNPTLIIGPCINNTIVLTSSVTNSNLNYQWVKWNTPIAGATNTSYTVTSNGAYRIAITDSCGTLRFTPLTQINVTTCRVEEITEEQAAQMVDVALYPNPNEGQFTINLSAYDLSTTPVNIDVYNVLGQVVYSKIINLTDGKLNSLIQLPSNVDDGLYNVRIRKGSFETYSKIVVSK